MLYQSTQDILKDFYKYFLPLVCKRCKNWDSRLNCCVETFCDGLDRFYNDEEFREYLKTSPLNYERFKGNKE